ncbi:aminoacyl-tRNA deacylase [Eremococcus coleocola]|uniref:Cys-tRNA(Pro)/Cys-tRNA(Cys) deacylase n=1 Tax=Eremococcus coleocola ACS-139-V-Col8 TaxID=908337 RepID=E4KQY7_9LACT|nr:aminoacyl-tRNA deacylase [Eremococcus coleocola]EFR30781.1 putative YbaK/EbsC protein [Eremococcus coleocola ACS-139-V-Col8]
MSKKHKTNVMRVLDQHKIDYEPIEWDSETIKKDHAQPDVFKTLVTVGKSGQNYVFVVPVDHELDLKKAAKAVSEKNIQMIKEKELLPLTGYVHGGCSPIGMKKLLTTVFDQSALEFETIKFSGGRRGFSVQVAPRAIEQVIPVTFQDLKTQD